MSSRIEEASLPLHKIRIRMDDPLKNIDKKHDNEFRRLK